MAVLVALIAVVLSETDDSCRRHATADELPEAKLQAPFVTVDLNVGESQEVTVPSVAGSADKATADKVTASKVTPKKVTVRLVKLEETRDTLRDAVRRAVATVQIDGEQVTLVSANYRLPVRVGKVRIDCPITTGYTLNASKTSAGHGPWGLDKAARIRVWAVEGPLLNPETFQYPAKQRWFASSTQMANEPVYVDGGERPGKGAIYYHYGLDIGGAEGLVDVVAATDGLVVSVGTNVLPGYKDTPVAPRYDVVYLLDDRGWFYRYSHLQTIASDLKPGGRVRRGAPIGILGKEGGSGGWSHLHFDISGRQPSGKWGIIDGYAFLWEAYRDEHQPKLIAVARPHHFAVTGDEVVLDGSRSWSAAGPIASYEWTATDGAQAKGPEWKRTYAKAGVYCETLKVTDEAGSVDYDFAIVHVLDREQPELLPPSIHATYSPTFGIRAGDPVKFLVRTFRTTDGEETWNFGDGTPEVKVQSDGNVTPLAKDGYAITMHRFEKPGTYLVSVSRTNDRGATATARLKVIVE